MNTFVPALRTCGSVPLAAHPRFAKWAAKMRDTGKLRDTIFRVRVINSIILYVKSTIFQPNLELFVRDFSSMPSSGRGGQIDPQVNQALHHIVKTRARPRRACKSSYATTPQSIRDIATKYGVSKSVLGRALKAYTNDKPLFSWRNKGRPPCLTQLEEAAIMAYAISLSRGHFPSYRKILKNAADSLRTARQPPVEPVISD